MLNDFSTWLNEPVNMPTYAYALLVLFVIAAMALLILSDRKNDKLEDELAECTSDFNVLADMLMDQVAVNASLVQHHARHVDRERQLVATLSELKPSEEDDTVVKRLSYCSNCSGLRWPEHFQMNPDHVVRRLDLSKPDDN